MLRLALYLRISMEDEDMGKQGKDESNSVGNQRTLLKQYIEKKESFHGASVIEFLDDGYTGRNFDRPGFQRLLEQCRKGNIDCILLKDLSRLGRNLVEVGDLIEQVFPFLGVRVISVTDYYDSNSYLGQTGGFEVSFQNLINNMYSRDLSEKRKSADRVRMKKGYYLAPYAMFGYKKAPDDTHKLIVNEKAAGIVKRIFTMKIEGNSTGRIASILNAEGVPTPGQYKEKTGCRRAWRPDGKKSGWNSSIVAKILRDERYCGHMVNGKMSCDSFNTGRQIPVDKSQWIIVKNTHEAIVSEETFEKARLSMSKKGNHSIGSTVRKDSRCVLFCPYCGLRLCKLPDRSRYYCRTRSNNPGMEKCRDVSIDLKKIEATLVEMVRQKAHIIEKVEERMKKNAKMDSDDSAESITKELDRIGEKRAGFYMDYKNGKITKEVFIQYKDELEKQKAELNQRILQLQAKDLEAGETDSKLEQAMEIKEYRDLGVYDNKTMAKLFDRVDVYGEDRIEVRWKFQDIFDVLEHDMN